MRVYILIYSENIINQVYQIWPILLLLSDSSDFNVSLPILRQFAGKYFLNEVTKSKSKWVWQNLFYSFLQLKYQFFALGVKFELTKVTYIY